MLMARLYSGNLSMVALGNAYHGGSVGTIGLTGLQMWKYPYPIPQVPHQTMQSEIHQVMNPDPYRGTFGSAASYAKEIEEYITHGGSGRVAGFIAETFQGVGGAVELAHGYLKLAYDIVQKAGGVCIADEVRSVITMTLGIPDTRCHSRHCTNAKGIGNGLPFRAVLTTSEIASVLSQKMQFNTFGGNPVCSAGGLGVLKEKHKSKIYNIHANYKCHVSQFGFNGHTQQILTGACKPTLLTPMQLYYLA